MILVHYVDNNYDELAPVTWMLNSAGEETDDIAEAICFTAALADGMFAAGLTSAFEFETPQ